MAKMARGLRYEWRETMTAKILSPDPFDEILTHFQSIQWVVKTLALRERPFKVINLGAGVRRITTNVDICQKCKGTGNAK